MKAEGKDVYDIKKAEEVVEETRLMIPDATRRLNNALEDLETLLVWAEGSSDLTRLLRIPSAKIPKCRHPRAIPSRRVS